LASEAAERHEARLVELNKYVPVEYADAKSAQGRVNEVVGRIAKLESDVEKFRKEVEEGEKAHAANVAQHGEVTKACKEAGEKLAVAKEKFGQDLLAEGFVDEALFHESLLAREEIGFLKEEIRKFDAAAAAAKSAREKAEEACKELTRPDLPSLGTVKSEADKAKNAALKARVQAGERKEVLEETKRQIGEALVAQKTLESSLAVVGRLANLASGENAKKVGLHTYYLARSASHRLDRMSRCRYRLRRTDEVGDARGKAGLDLVVSDSWSGAERPVRTLSGGESFLASLSLALGLSDAVLAQSGGRSLDSLFVDEGFGSLDQESLDMALRTLQELQGAGTASGRAVGIISHIDEVKKAVGKRIEVTRNPGEATSTVEIMN
jgi:exonuclease SbcC